VDYTLTVLGKIGDFNVTFASGYLHRDTRQYAEYVDYSLAYQSIEPFLPKNPMMFDPRWNYYQQISNELRVTTPIEYPIHGTVGLYQDRQQNQGYLNEPVPGLDPTLEVGYGTPQPWPGTIYLDNLETVARDYAVFGQVSWDINSHITATAGFRRFRYDNTVQGFYGYSANYPFIVFGGSTTTSGQELCFVPFTPFHGAPCQDENKRSESWGSVPLFTLSYKFDPDHLVYATFSKGYRPGGPNRTYGVGPYSSDFLTNYEIGWKTAWLDHHLIFNGDAYVETWKNYQFGFTGPNGIGITANAASAESKGWDESLQWLVASGLTFTLNVSYADAYLTSNYCKNLDSSGQPISSADCIGPGVPVASTPLAFDGYRLTDDSVWSGFASVRYSFPFANGTAFVEGDQSYKSFYWPDGALETQFRLSYGQVPSYGLTNFSLGLDKNNWELELLVQNLFNRNAVIDKQPQLTAAVAIAQFNTIAPPRLIGLQFTQNF
jgi:iron complex outermembrane recepter protein